MLHRIPGGTRGRDAGPVGAGVVQRAAAERREAGAEDRSRVHEIGIRDDAIFERGLRLCDERSDETIGDTRVWVLPNPSGLNASFQLPELVRLFRELKAASLR